MMKSSRNTKSVSKNLTETVKPEPTRVGTMTSRNSKQPKSLSKFLNKKPALPKKETSSASTLKTIKKPQGTLSAYLST